MSRSPTRSFYAAQVPSAFILLGIFIETIGNGDGVLVAPAW